MLETLQDVMPNELQPERNTSISYGLSWSYFVQEDYHKGDIWQNRGAHEAHNGTEYVQVRQSTAMEICLGSPSLAGFQRQNPLVGNNRSIYNRRKIEEKR